MTWTVSLVGRAGDTELLPGTARRHIENADVVPHDELLGPAFLESIVDLRDTVGNEPPESSAIADVVGSRGPLTTFLEKSVRIEEISMINRMLLYQIEPNGSSL